MGYNTSVIVMNDALSNIEQDEEFGRTLVRAALRLNHHTGPIEVPSRNYLNAAYVLESHHSSSVVPVLMGRNIGVPIDIALQGFIKTNNVCGPAELEQELLQRLAQKYGYRLVRKKKAG